MRKLNARVNLPHNIVLNEEHRPLFVLSITTRTVTRREKTEIYTRISELINAHGLEIHPRQQEE